MALFASPLVYAAEAVQKPLEAGATIGIKGGRTLYLEVQLPKGSAKAEVLKRYLENENSWTQYQKLKTAYFHFRDLKPAVQRRVMETIFPDDYSDKTGWWHKVTYEGAAGVESWWNLAEWLTGKGTNYKALEAMPENQGYKGALTKGQVLLVPRNLLAEAFKTPTPGLPGRTGVLLEPMDVHENVEPYRPLLPGELTYGKDAKGEYAVYAMKKGEAIYTSVIIRFTDYREVIAVQDAAAEVLKRNGIEDPTRIHVDQEIRIPRDMLADEYQPEGSAQRMATRASASMPNDSGPGATA